MLDRKAIETAKSQYPKGTKVHLDAYLDDPYIKLTPGQMGIVRCVDDIGQVHVDWDSGSRLALIPGVDEFSII